MVFHMIREGATGVPTCLCEEPSMIDLREPFEG